INTFEYNVGDMQISLMLAQQNVDNMLFYLDQSAKYSAHAAAFTLAHNGGHASALNACGGYVQGYAIWNSCKNPENICFPDIFNNFNKLVSVNLDQYLITGYATIIGTQSFIKDNYIFTVHDNKLTGTAIKDIEMNVVPYKPKGKAYSIGKYSFKPSFSVDFNYDFNKYFELRDLAIELAKCAGKFQVPGEREACVLAKAPAASIVGNYAFLDVEQPEYISPYSKQFPTIKFGLCIPLIPVPPSQAPAVPSASAKKS
ncbi:MAG: hypothetical protein QW666_03405, partial [Candidatus Woesearchaeota archaeon]